MHNDMSQKTKKEVLVRLRRAYAKAGQNYKQEPEGTSVAVAL
jgi:hypothetical protein